MLAFGLMVGASTVAVAVDAKPAEALHTWQVAQKCVYWPAGVGNWGFTPYWKIKFGTDYYQPYFVADAAQNRSNYTWIYGATIAFIREVGYGRYDRYGPSTPAPNYGPPVWGAVNYMSLRVGESEPTHYESSKPWDNDLAYSNRGHFGSEQTRTVAFAPNVLNCNTKDANGNPAYYGPW